MTRPTCPTCGSSPTRACRDPFHDPKPPASERCTCLAAPGYHATGCPLGPAPTEQRVCCRCRRTVTGAYCYVCADDGYRPAVVMVSARRYTYASCDACGGRFPVDAKKCPKCGERVVALPTADERGRIAEAREAGAADMRERAALAADGIARLYSLAAADRCVRAIRALPLTAPSLVSNA